MFHKGQNHYGHWIIFFLSYISWEGAFFPHMSPFSNITRHFNIGFWSVVRLANTFPISVFFSSQVQAWGQWGLDQNLKLKKKQSGQGVEGPGDQWILNFNGPLVQGQTIWTVLLGFCSLGLDVVNPRCSRAAFTVTRLEIITSYGHFHVCSSTTFGNLLNPNK